MEMEEAAFLREEIKEQRALSLEKAQKANGCKKRGRNRCGGNEDPSSDLGEPTYLGEGEKFSVVWEEEEMVSLGEGRKKL